MVVDHLHAIDLALGIHGSELLGDVDAAVHVGLVGQGHEVACGLESEFCDLLGYLAADGINDDIILAEMLVLVECLLHLLDDVGIESAAERGVAGIDNQGHTLDGPLLEEGAAELGIRGQEGLEDVLEHFLVGEHVLDGHLCMVELG